MQTERQLFQAQLGVATASLWVVPPNDTRTKLTEILVSNTSALPVSVTFYGGPTQSVATTILPGVSVPGNTSVQFTYSTMFEPGQTIWGQASVAGVIGCTATGIVNQDL